MAMNKSSLGSLIKSKIDQLSTEEQLQDISVWTAVAEAIIDHIKSDAEIASLTQSGISVAPPSSVITQGETSPGQKGKIS